MLYSQNIGTESSIINEKSPINVINNEFITTAKTAEIITIITENIDKLGKVFKNNIPIIRIPYLKDNIFLKDLLLETSKYVLTKENENEYYRIN